jgi:hypothetical protein
MFRVHPLRQLLEVLMLGSSTPDRPSIMLQREQGIPDSPSRRTRWAGSRQDGCMPKPKALQACKLLPRVTATKSRVSRAGRRGSSPMMRWDFDACPTAHERHGRNASSRLLRGSSGRRGETRTRRQKAVAHTHTHTPIFFASLALRCEALT